MADTTVKYFNYAMSGASSIVGNAAGSLLSVLNDCLLNGFGSVTASSLVVSSNVATATFGSDHNFAMTGDIGPVITIAGATPAGLNGEHRITVTSTTQFTFVTSGIADQTATGTITANRSPLGWVAGPTGTNLAAYQQGGGNQFFLRVDDTTDQYSSLCGYTAMTDVNTGTDKWPTSTTYYYHYKASVADSTARRWHLIGNNKAFYLFIANNTSYVSSFGGMFFGDIISYRLAGDGYNTALIGSTSTSSAPSLQSLSFSGLSGHQLARNHTQGTVGASFGLAIYGSTNSSVGMANDSNYPVNYPDPMNNGIIAVPVGVTEGYSQGYRGRMPGLLAPLHYRNPPHETYFTDTSGLHMITMQCGSGSGNYYRICVAIDGPWT